MASYRLENGLNTSNAIFPSTYVSIWLSITSCIFIICLSSTLDLNGGSNFSNATHFHLLLHPRCPSLPRLNLFKNYHPCLVLPAGGMKRHSESTLPLCWLSERRWEEANIFVGALTADDQSAGGRHTNRLADRKRQTEKQMGR